MSYLEGETFTIVDRWGDQLICYSCRSEDFFTMFPPDDILQVSPVTYCVRCKRPTSDGILFPKYIVESALDGVPLPDTKKISALEYYRRDVAELNDQLESVRQEYKHVKNSWLEGRAKELMLQSIVEHGESIKQSIAERKQQIRGKLIHG